MTKMFVRYGILVSASLAPASCGKPAPELPAERMAAAATCYAAAVERVKTERMTAAQVDDAAHFLFLAAVNDGLASPTALEKAAEQGNGLRRNLAHAEAPDSYAGPCAKRFPETVAGRFKTLPADSRDTRMMCLTLSTSLLQTYQSSGVVPPAETVAMNAKLDSGLMAEFNAEANLNPAELAGSAMRSMAKAVELGPLRDVIGACVKRYGG